MKYKTLFLSVIFLFFTTLNLTYADKNAHVEMFSPQGTVKNIRQVNVRFSEQMVPFGDPRLVEPFDIKSPEKGKARWADGKNWIYDFDRDLPAGIICEFTLKPDLKTLSGKKITGKQQFSFSTSGPAIKESYPHEGSERIDENQIFILTIDADATEESIMSNVSCTIEGINEHVGVRILKGEEREVLLKARRYKRYKDMPEVVIQCKQGLPNNSMVRLIWGKGVMTHSGVQTTEDQILHFKTRNPFIAAFSCRRENPEAKCIPMLPMRLEFSAPVSKNYSGKIILKGPGNKIYRPSNVYED